MDDETAKRIRERLRDEANTASDGVAEGLRRRDRNMIGANTTRAIAFEEAISILDDETAKT